RGVAFSRDDALAASASDDRAVRLWDTGLLERSGVLRGHTSYVYDVAFSPDGKQIASAAWDGTVRLWDATTGRPGHVLRHGDPADEANILSSVAFSPDGKQLASVVRGDRAYLWDVATGERKRVFGAPTGAWDAQPLLSFNRAGTLLAVGCRDGKVRLWD